MKKLLVHILNELKMINLQLRCIRKEFECHTPEKQAKVTIDGSAIKGTHRNDYLLYQRAINGDLEAMIEWLTFKGPHNGMPEKIIQLREDNTEIDNLLKEKELSDEDLILILSSLAINPAYLNIREHKPYSRY